jgi:hypothetical protein
VTLGDSGGELGGREGGSVGLGWNGLGRSVDGCSGTGKYCRDGCDADASWRLELLCTVTANYGMRALAHMSNIIRLSLSFLYMQAFYVSYFVLNI